MFLFVTNLNDVNNFYRKMSRKRCKTWLELFCQRHLYKTIYIFFSFQTSKDVRKVKNHFHPTVPDPVFPFFSQPSLCKLCPLCFKLSMQTYIGYVWTRTWVWRASTSLHGSAGQIAPKWLSSVNVLNGFISIPVRFLWAVYFGSRLRKCQDWQYQN